MLITWLTPKSNLFCFNYNSIFDFLTEEELNNPELNNDQIIEKMIWSTANLNALYDSDLILTFFSCLDVIFKENDPYTLKCYLHKYADLQLNKPDKDDEYSILTGYYNIRNYLEDNYKNLLYKKFSQ